MLKQRVIPPDVARAYRKPRRALRLAAESRSLVNSNQLATSDPNLCRTESFDEEYKRRNAAKVYRCRQLALQNQLLASLEYLAIRNKSADYVAGELGAPLPPQTLSESERGPWDAGKDYRRLVNCHTEFVGYKPNCCSSAAVAIPCNCNHRLCCLCNSGRLEQYRSKCTEMLATMKNPCFLTLTVPNVRVLTKQTFAEIRAAWTKFRKNNPILAIGGVYSIETTFNRETREFHPHIHVLFESPWKVSMSHGLFVAFKMRLELQWLLAVDPSANKRFPTPGVWRVKVPGARARNASLPERHEKRFLLWAMETKGREKGCDWNKQNRRVIDIRRVAQGKITDGRDAGKSAVYEVIKYISKTNRFLDIPEAVEGYLRAVRGVRIIQTFGKFYKFKFDEDFKPETFMQCDCGKHDFVRVGLFGLASVYQAESGCWYLKRQHQDRQRCRGGPQ